MKIVNFLAFQVAWFSCVLGAAKGSPWWGSVVAAGVIGLHLFLRPAPLREFVIVGACGLYGAIAESVQQLAGVTSFPSASLWVGASPLWMVALWASFGTTLTSSMAWLQERFWLSAGLGAVAGPLAYFGGERMGGLELSSNRWLSATSVGLVYLIAMPLLLRLARTVAPSPADENSSTPPSRGPSNPDHPGDSRKELA